MTFIADLWLPILLSAVLVFAVSSVIHMGPFWHRSEFPPLGEQDRIQDALRPFGIAPGEYMLPRPKNMKDCDKPEFVEKLTRGPVMLLTVIPNGRMSMGRPLAQWFVYTVFVSALAAYVVHATVAADAPYLEVFRVAGTVAFAAYAVGLWQSSIWFHRPWSSTIKHTLDGFIYGCLTGGAFGWLTA
jgi:hypothetical protein